MTNDVRLIAMLEIELSIEQNAIWAANTIFPF